MVWKPTFDVIVNHCALFFCSLYSQGSLKYLYFEWRTQHRSFTTMYFISTLAEPIQISKLKITLYMYT